MKLRLFTYVYSTFVFLQVFNQFNCRRIGQNEFNVFEKIWQKRNWYFWGMIFIITFGQILQVQWFWFLSRTTPLNSYEWFACMFVGSSVIAIAYLLKLTGTFILSRIPFTKFVDEDKEMEDTLVSRITAAQNV